MGGHSRIFGGRGWHNESNVKYTRFDLFLMGISLIKVHLKKAPREGQGNGKWKSNYCIFFYADNKSGHKQGG